jgi:hypothetical protein
MTRFWVGHGFSRAVFMTRFWVGHGFSRAVQGLEKCGLQPLRDVPSERKGIYETSSSQKQRCQKKEDR